MDPKTSRESDFADESSSSSSSGHNLRAEKMVEVKSEPEFSRKIQKSDREKIRRDKLNEHFLKLENALDSNKPKSDKATILTDTIHTLKDLMNQVDTLKAEYATLSQESLELAQEKSELREEKATLKADIEILKAQYQLRVMVPWIPHCTYPISAQMFPLSATHKNAIFMPCSSSSSCALTNKDSKSKSLEKKDDLGLDLELKIHGSSSSAQEDGYETEKKGSSKTDFKFIK